MSTYTPTAPLTADQVKALRRAGKGVDNSRFYIVADRRTTPALLASGAATYSVDIIETIRQPLGAVPANVEIRTTYPAIGEIVVYGHFGRESTVGPYRYVAGSDCSFWGAQASPLRGIASVVKEGDELVVSFIINDTPTSLSDAGWSTNTCRLTVARQGRPLVTVDVENRVFRKDKGGSFADYSYRPEEAAS